MDAHPNEWWQVTLSADEIEALRYVVETADHCVRAHAASATYSAVMGKLARAYDVLARAALAATETR
jgi:hypothetical protein